MCSKVVVTTSQEHSCQELSGYPRKIPTWQEKTALGEEMNSVRMTSDYLDWEKVGDTEKIMCHQCREKTGVERMESELSWLIECPSGLPEGFVRELVMRRAWYNTSGRHC